MTNGVKIDFLAYLQKFHSDSYRTPIDPDGLCSAQRQSDTGICPVCAVRFAYPNPNCGSPLHADGEESIELRIRKALDDFILSLEVASRHPDYARLAKGLTIKLAEAHASALFVQRRIGRTEGIGKCGCEVHR